MIAIRLSRLGRKKAPFYRIVAVDSTKKAVGEVLEVIGTWNPKHKELVINKENLATWIKKGAQMSVTIKKLVEDKK